MRRRQWVKTVLAALAAVGVNRRRESLAAPAEVKLPDDSPVQVFDFEAGGIEGWTTIVDGQPVTMREWPMTSAARRSSSSARRRTNST